MRALQSCFCPESWITAEWFKSIAASFTNGEQSDWSRSDFPPVMWTRDSRFKNTLITLGVGGAPDCICGPPLYLGPVYKNESNLPSDEFQAQSIDLRLSTLLRHRRTRLRNTEAIHLSDARQRGLSKAARWCRKDVGERQQRGRARTARCSHRASIRNRRLRGFSAETWSQWN